MPSGSEHCTVVYDFVLDDFAPSDSDGRVTLMRASDGLSRADRSWDLSHREWKRRFVYSILLHHPEDGVPPLPIRLSRGLQLTLDSASMGRRRIGTQVYV